MYKLKLFSRVLLLILILSFFSGCRVLNQNLSTNEITEPSGDVTVSSDKMTAPSSEATEPSTEAITPTETVGPRTVDFLKSHLTPYITYAEACALFGHPDEVGGNTFNIRYPRWDLEDGYFVRTVFYPTINETYAEYDATEPNKETNPDGTSVVWNLPIWFDHMEAYQAVLCKENPTGKGQAEIVEVWFEYPDPWYQGE